jgi:hypothetical protein
LRGSAQAAGADALWLLLWCFLLDVEVDFLVLVLLFLAVVSDAVDLAAGADAAGLVWAKAPKLTAVAMTAAMRVFMEFS